LFVAIERLCKFAYVELYEAQSMENAVSFLERTINACPFKIHTILTDNGTQFSYAALAAPLRPKRRHWLERVCQKHGIRFRRTPFFHPWTNGQVERFNGTLKQHTTKTYHYDSLTQLKQHLHDFVMAYNFQRPLKSLKRKTPYQVIQQEYAKMPKLFHKHPNHYLVGTNT